MAHMYLLKEKRPGRFFGNIDRKKGVIELVKASVLLNSQNVSHRLVINGKDSVLPGRGVYEKVAGGVNSG